MPRINFTPSTLELYSSAVSSSMLAEVSDHQMGISLSTKLSLEWPWYSSNKDLEVITPFS